jgi:hypothetical protein
MSQSNQKSGFKFFSPFRILERVSSVTYCLELSASSSIHPVLHVSQLKLGKGFRGPISTQLPSDSVHLCVPMGSRVVMRNTGQVTQALICWSELPKHLAS